MQKFVLIIGDLITMGIAFLCAIIVSKIYHNELFITPFHNFFNIGISKFFSICVIFIFMYYGHYSKRRPFWEETLQIFKILSVILVINFGLAFILGKYTLKSLMVSFWVFYAIMLPIMRIIVKNLLSKLGLWQRDLYIIGYGDTATEAYQLFARNKLMGYSLKAFVDIIHDTPMPLAHLPVELIGKQNLLQNLNEQSDCDIIVAVSANDLNNNLQLINYLQHNCNSIMVLPTISGLGIYGSEVEHFFGNDQLVLRLNNNLSKFSNKVIKKIFDLTFGFVILIAISPILIFLAVKIKRSSKGNILYHHRRIGKDGEPFYCLKFQTMYSNSQELLEEILANDEKAKKEWQQSFKLKNDPRVTPIGKFLRESSLDELPQIFNVLMGQMSLVGPRPIVFEEIEKYKESYYYYKLTTPGITGLWQVSGRSDVNYSERVRLDEWYVKNWSLWYDIVILFKTIGVVFKRVGAY